MPVNTIQNWRNEFNKWSPSQPIPSTSETGAETTTATEEQVDHRTHEVYAIDESSRLFEQKVHILDQWRQRGGTLLLGYETFRILVQKRKSDQGIIDQVIINF